MVRNKNGADDREWEDQHMYRQIQDVGQSVSRQAALSHGGNYRAVTRDLSAIQKQLVGDVVEKVS